MPPEVKGSDWLLQYDAGDGFDLRQASLETIAPLTRLDLAARTFGGDIGSSVSRVPTARSIALAMAAIRGQMLISAAPLAP
jgi:hypothetical protein